MTSLSLSLDPILMTKFVKIVERYPDLYDNNSDAYRRVGSADKTWSLVAVDLKNEMNVDCTVDELKTKWKGIRSSYSRYKAKLYRSRNGLQVPKKYYLSDALNYLEPFTKPKSIRDNPEEEIDYAEDDDVANANEYDNLFEWTEIEAKPEIVHHDYGEQSSEGDYTHSRKRPKLNNSVDEDEKSNGDLHFFRSILPDIEHFTGKEKRRFKIGVLELIDKIEDERASKRIKL